jgi:hypothetical protein
MKTATITIGRFTLRLSPLPQRELPAARKAWYRLVVTPLMPVGSSEWFAAHDDALGFVFIAARANDRRLSFADLYDEAEPEEIVEAFKALSRLMRERWGLEWEKPGRLGGEWDRSAKGCAENRA